jgi:hypothetical protein
MTSFELKSSIFFSGRSVSITTTTLEPTYPWDYDLDNDIDDLDDYNDDYEDDDLAGKDKLYSAMFCFGLNSFRFLKF